jgi:hypothetical protein
VKNKVIWIYDPIHCQNLYVLIGHSKEQIEKFTKKQTGIPMSPDFTPSLKGSTFFHESGHIFIWVRKFEMSILFHEITHATCYALMSRGYTPTLNDHEELAYMNGFLVREILAKLKS